MSYGIAGNCKADDLARKITLTPTPSGWKTVGVPLSSDILALYLWNSAICGNEIYLAHSRTKEIHWITFPWEVFLSSIVVVLTRQLHDRYSYGEAKIEHKFSKLYEISIHFFHHCWAFAKPKLKHIDVRTFGQGKPGELVGIDISCVNKFMKRSKGLRHWHVLFFTHT